MTEWLLTLAPGFALGAVSVAQGGLNRRSAEAIGLDAAVLLNNFVLLAVSIVGLLALGRAPVFSRVIAILRPDPAHLKYWLPGLLGLALVAGIPYAVGRVGAVRLFVPLVAAQLLFSLAWDGWLENIPLTWPRALGTLIALVGAALTTF